MPHASDAYAARRGRAPARPRSELPGLVWPVVLTGPAATMELLQAQFRDSERASPQAILARQHAQIDQLAAHAHARSPFWRARLEAAGYRPGGPGVGSGHWFAALPTLSRGEARSAGDDLFALPVPPEHGRVHAMKTSGSTGTPLEIRKTDLALTFWSAIDLRDSLWRHSDLRGTFAAIRVGAQRATHAGWGAAYAGYDNGPGLTFDAREDIDAQLDWLDAERPQILLTHASNLRALALRSIELGRRLDGLQEARSFSECVPPDLRERVHEAWRVPLSDMYTANEVGYVALECPDSGLYHVQSEDVLVEVIDDAGRPCAPGQTGRVVVSSLHNFAMPLLRYELGDHATAGGPCPCGRTLPTLERIHGRTRNMLRLPQGRMAWPGFPMNTLMRLQAIRELKMIQHSLDEIEVELVLARPLTADEQTTLADAVRARLMHPFRVRLTPVERILRGPGHKREDFECRMS